MEYVISIIIPTLNEENYLPNLLEDLKAQSVNHFEVIVVDAHSEDHTKEVALKFAKDLNLRFLESPKRHLSYQRNYAAEKAHGEYLFFLDADSRIRPDVIENSLKHIEKEHHELYLPELQPSERKIGYKILIRGAGSLVKMLNNLNIPFSTGPMILIKKDLFIKIGGFSLITTASEDHNLIIKAYKEGVKVKFMKDVECDFSMRRFERDGTGTILCKYTIFTIETLFKGGVYRKSTNYVMGGQEYKK